MVLNKANIKIIIMLIFFLVPVFKSSNKAEKKRRFSCDDELRIRNDSYFFIEGRGVWSLFIGDRRSDLRLRKINPLYITRNRPGDLYVFQGAPREGTIQFKGTSIMEFTVFFPAKGMISEPEQIFYHSCRGFYYPDLQKAKSIRGYLKNLYKSKFYDTGDWLYFPYVGIAWHFEGKKLRAFKIFKPVELKDGFEFKDYYRKNIY